MLKIVGQIKALISWVQEKLQSVIARPVEQVAMFLTSPLADTEYALLKRVSGIVGSAVAVWISNRVQSDFQSVGEVDPGTSRG